MIMILKQDPYILYININTDLFVYGNWKAMHLKTAYKWCYIFICTRQDGLSNSAVCQHCVLVSRQSLVSCQCLITRTTVICCLCVCRQWIVIPFYINLCVTVLYVSSVLFIVLCVTGIYLHFILRVCAGVAVININHIFFSISFSTAKEKYGKITLVGIKPGTLRLEVQWTIPFI